MPSLRCVYEDVIRVIIIRWTSMLQTASLCSSVVPGQSRMTSVLLVHMSLVQFLSRIKRRQIKWSCASEVTTLRRYTNLFIIISIIFKPTSTKPQAEKLGYTYKIIVATAIYSVTMVLWKETAFPLCRATEKRWKRNVVSRVSSVIVAIRLPISCVSSMSISCQVPAVSMANG